MTVSDTVLCVDSVGMPALGEAVGRLVNVGSMALRVPPSPAKDAVGGAPEGVTEGLGEAEPLALGE